MPTIRRSMWLLALLVASMAGDVSAQDVVAPVCSEGTQALGAGFCVHHSACTDVTTAFVSAGAVASVGGDALVLVGGRQEATTTLRRFTPSTMALGSVRHMSTARKLPAAVAIDGERVLVVGGLSDDGTALSTSAIIDLRTFGETAGPPLAQGRVGAQIFGFGDGRALVWGGRDESGDPIASVAYDDGTRFSTVGTLPA